MSKTTILLAEDDLDLLNIEERFLIHAGYSVLCAQDISRALRFVAKESPDLLVLDINMPTGSGICIHERLRSIPTYRDTPVIYTTGERSAAIQSRLGEMEAFAVIYKPFNLDVLLTEVKAALRVPFKHASEATRVERTMVSPQIKRINIPVKCGSAPAR